MSDYYAHESSYIDDDCDIGAETKIWHFCHIMSGTKLGQQCSVGQNCVIGPNVTLGNQVKVQNNVSIYDGVECEDDVFLGPSMVFTNINNPRSHIERRHAFKKTLLRRGCTVGANATIICGVTIGEYALIGAGAVVTKDIPPYALVYGNPARQQGWVGQAGNRLEFDEQGFALDQEDGQRYQLSNGSVQVLAKD